MKNKSLLLTTALAAFALVAFAHADTPLEEARAALKADDLPKAETLLMPLTGADSKDAAASFTLGQLRERQKNLKGAIAAYEQATRLDQTSPEYFSALGVALSQRMGEINFMQQAMTAGKMKKAFEQSVALDPQHVSGLIGLTRYYTNAPAIAGGSREKAVEFAERVRALVPFLGELELGNIASHEEDFVDALTHYEAAGKLNPTHGYVQYRCGQMLVKLGKPDEARVRFETALKLDPNLDAARQALAPR